MNKLFLIATVAGRTVAIDSDQVDSVVDITEVTPVPRTVPEVRGLAALRSRVVTVVDTRAALGLAPSDGVGNSRAVITVFDGHHYAIMVDALQDVAPFDLQPMIPGMRLDGVWQRTARGVVDHNGEPVLAIALAAMIPGAGAATAAAAA